MYLEELAELALGLILVFIVMSLAVMQIQEVLAGWLRWRSDQLEKALHAMLTDRRSQGWIRDKAQNLRAWYTCDKYFPLQLDSGAQVPNQKRTWSEKIGLWLRFRHARRHPTFVDKLYEHPLLRSLAQPGNKPSYLPADKFALALFDTVMTAGTDASTIQKALEELREKEKIIRSTKLHELLDSPEVENWIDALIARAECVVQKKNNYPDLSILYDEINRFTYLYPELKPLFNAILQSKLPRSNVEVFKQLENSSKVLVVDNPELRQVLDSLFRQSETYVEEAIKAKILGELKSKAEDLEEEELAVKQKLSDLIERTSSEVQEFEARLAQTRNQVEQWFDDTMDRSAGWYKRNALLVSFMIGFTLALAFNVDAIAIGAQLWRQPALRQALAAQAENFQLPTASDPAQVSQPLEELSNSLNAMQIPVGWSFSPVTFDPQLQRCTWRVTDPQREIYGLPISGQCLVWANAPPDLLGWLTKLVGIVFVAGAAMQGAPFWFDILKKITNVRSAGSVPAKEQPTSEKDQQK